MQQGRSCVGQALGSTRLSGIPNPQLCGLYLSSRETLLLNCRELGSQINPKMVSKKFAESLACGRLPTPDPKLRSCNVEA